MVSLSNHERARSDGIPPFDMLRANGSGELSATFTKLNKTPLPPNMKMRIDCLELGKPRFNDPELAKIATRDGIEDAWQQAFQRFRSRAAEGVSGDFAFALRKPNSLSRLAAGIS